ncbi:4a-hydroxytetrahydrobiopterin dehydratase [Flexivirga sp. ID2601S]|uniref:Putative pterin-4-alpha-carbinolamine dehydratase n=1 Tax=Flexivirga aerilata TaxID=1656889 RepID=A0A849AIQ2_9MICO|nr:4a-hydroxytetrahydrobiopterin dehydratase [Flexivirga aerilata]NNG39128.1 4a-hydroxytetrahydrobiopterin dehydratase [Flexivirga aerilata]
MSRLLTDEEIERQLRDLPGWSRAGDTLRSSYDTTTFPGVVDLISRVADDAEQMNHHPDFAVSYTHIDWTLSTHSEHGITQLDIELAHRIAEAAAQVGAEVTR